MEDGILEVIRGCDGYTIKMTLNGETKGKYFEFGELWQLVGGDPR